METTTTDAAQVQVWIYRSIKKLSPEQENDIDKMAGDFIAQWAAHGKSLAADFDILHGHYLIFFVDSSVAEATGCSIDASVHLIREIEAKYQLGLLDRMQIGFLKNNEVEFHHFNEIKSEIAAGKIKETDLVFNAMLSNKKEFDEGFLLPLSQSAFFSVLR
jgi:hypothetical protein